MGKNCSKTEEEYTEINKHKRANTKEKYDDDNKSDFSTDDEWNIDFEISPKSKRAITAAFVLSKVIFEYFTAKETRCEYLTDAENKELANSILSNILIQGGATRDILIGESINDIDIMCNTRELNKIHLDHLRKYHSTSTNGQQSECLNCCLWQLYLNKFTKESSDYNAKIFEELKEEYKGDQEKMMTTNKYIRDASYILNAKYLVHVLKHSFGDSLQCKIITRPSLIVFVLCIVGKFMFNGMNLEGQDFDFVDMPKKDQNIQIADDDRAVLKTYHAKNSLLSPKDKLSSVSYVDIYIRFCAYLNMFLKQMKHRIPSMRMKSDEIQWNVDKDNLIEISLPICQISIDLHADSCDFTINSTVLRLFDIKRILECDNGNDGCFEIDLDIYNKLREALIGENEEYKMNIMRSIRLKLLTSTYKTVSQKANVYRHFWRCIKFGIRYFDLGWRVNPNLIKWYQQLYGQWMANEEWINDENMQNIQIKQQFNYGYANNLDEYTKMMKLFDVLHYHKVLQNALQTNKQFKSKWIDALLQKDQSIINLFKQNGYPTIK